jgi:hypothetical protein
LSKPLAWMARGSIFSLPGFSAYRLSKPHAGAPTVFVDEFDASKPNEFSTVAHILSLLPGCICGLSASCFCCRLESFGSIYKPSKTNARLAAIGKLDTGCLECPLQRFDRSLLQFISSLKPGNRVDRHLSRGSELSNTQSQSRTSHATLDRQKNNHSNVPISVEIVDFVEYRNQVLISVQK